MKKFINKIKKWFSELGYSECPKCKVKAVCLSHEEIIGRTIVNAYKCKNCNNFFV